MGDDNNNWYRQLLALLLLSMARAAVEYISNPRSRDQAAEQLKEAFRQIDYDAAAKALTSAIDDAASTSKERLNDTIDILRDRGVEAVGEAKSRAEQRAGKKRGGRRVRFLFGLIIGGVIAYFLLDEQRRDDILDRLTGASGPIEQTTQNMASQVTQEVQTRVDQASDEAKQAGTQANASVQQGAETAKSAADKATESQTEKK